MKNIIFSSWTKFEIMLLALLSSYSSFAQKYDNDNHLTRSEYSSYIDYSQHIVYYGKKEKYLTIKTYLPDSSLNRIDSYQIIDRSWLAGRYDGTKIAIKQGPSTIYFPAQQVYLQSNYRNNELDGSFVTFYQDGSIKRREYYNNGYLKKSHCYDSLGTEQTKYIPYFSPPKFIGNTSEFSSYLRNNLTNIIDGQSVIDVKIFVFINEIGQIINVINYFNQTAIKPMLAIDSKTNSMLVQLIKRIPQSMPNSSNWTPATQDGRPTIGQWTILAFRREGNVIFEYNQRLP